MDRAPVSFYKHFPDLTDNTVKDQVAWAKNTGIDMLCIEIDGFMEYDCGAVEIHTPSDLKKIRTHKRTDPFIVKQLDRAKRIADGLRDGASVNYILCIYYTCRQMA